MKYLRIYTDESGESHLEDVEVEMNSIDFAPPAPPLDLSAPIDASRLIMMHAPAGWFGDWHPTPVRQWLILMSGECEFETGDGERCRRKAGDVVMLDDTEGKGHCTRVIGDVPMRIAATHLPK